MSSLRSSLRRFVRRFDRSFVASFVALIVRSFVASSLRSFVASFVRRFASFGQDERVLCHTGRQNTQQSDRNNVFNQACDMTYTRRVPAPSRTPVCVARDDGGGDNDDGLT